MIPFEMVFAASSDAVTGVALWYIRYVARMSGRDRPGDPEAVQRLIDRAMALPDAKRLRL